MPGNREHNEELINELRKMADNKGVTAAQLALAWVLHKGEDIVTLIGTTKRARLLENLKCESIQLSPQDLDFLDKTFHESAFAGDRYPEFVTDVVR